MDNFTDKKPVLNKGWLRVVLFFIAYLFIILLLAVPLVLSFMPVNLSDQPIGVMDSISGFISNSLWLIVLIEFLASVIAVFVFRKFIDRKTIASMGFGIDGRMPEMVTGFFVAPALIGLGAVFLFFTKHLEWDFNGFDAPVFFLDFGIMALVAFSEELVFRGYVLNNLMESFNKWIALVISAILFMLFHLSNPGISLFSFVSLFLAGILLGINYIYTKNLWFSFLLHFSWNFFQGQVYGFKVSGLHFSSILEASLKGDASITGGNFGFEGSIASGMLLFITVAIFYFVYERKFSGLGVNRQ